MTATTLDKKQKMKQRRQAITCTAPSGEEVTIRPTNLEHHALAGGLPARLKSIASEGIEAVDKAIEDATSGDPEMLTYLDSIVARLFVDPEIEPPVWALTEEPPDAPEDWEASVVLVSGEDPNEILLPIDYKWALLVAFGEMDFDGEGKRLWGREPISRFRLFREEHGCPEGCEGCVRVATRVSVGGAS